MTIRLINTLNISICLYSEYREDVLNLPFKFAYLQNIILFI